MTASANPPEIPPVVEAALHDIETQSDAVGIWFRLHEDTDVFLEFAHESPAAGQLLDLIGELVSETFARLGQQGVVFTGFTPPEANGEET